MPRANVSTASRSQTVSLRGGSAARRTYTRTTTRKAPYSGYRRGAPTYYKSKTTTRRGLPISRRTSSWTPRVSKPKMNIPAYIVANHNAFRPECEGVKVGDYLLIHRM